MIKRFESYFGNDGVETTPEGKVKYIGRHKPFVAEYAFNGSRYAITVWATTTENAQKHCFELGLIFKGGPMTDVLHS